jgi:hypothetical protein
MPTKISEKKLSIGIVLITLGLAVLLKATLIATPIQVSEVGILLALVSIVLIITGIMFFKRSMIRMK